MARTMNTVPIKIVNQDEWATLAVQNLQTERVKLANGYVAGNARIGRIARNKTAQAETSIESCEKCGRNTFFTVEVIGRRAYWCGCE